MGGFCLTVQPPRPNTIPIQKETSYRRAFGNNPHRKKQAHHDAKTSSIRTLIFYSKIRKR